MFPVEPGLLVLLPCGGVNWPTGRPALVETAAVPAVEERAGVGKRAPACDTLRNSILRTDETSAAGSEPWLSTEGILMIPAMGVPSPSEPDFLGGESRLEVGHLADIITPTEDRLISADISGLIPSAVITLA